MLFGVCVGCCLLFVDKRVLPVLVFGRWMRFAACWFPCGACCLMFAVVCCMSFVVLFVMCVAVWSLCVGCSVFVVRIWC